MINKRGVHHGCFPKDFQIPWEVLRDLVPFVQFKKREKHPWKSATFTNSKTPTYVFSTFFTFLSCANGAKWRKVSHIFLEPHLKSCFFREYLLETFVVVVTHSVNVSKNFVAIDKHNLYSVHFVNPFAWQETDRKFSPVQGNYK